MLHSDPVPSNRAMSAHSTQWRKFIFLLYALEKDFFFQALINATIMAVSVLIGWETDHGSNEATVHGTHGTHLLNCVPPARHGTHGTHLLNFNLIFLL